MVVHHLGETLQIVVTKKTVPVGLPLPQQSNGKPGGGKHQGESETWTRAQPPQQPSSFRAKQPKQSEAEGEQDNRHRSLAEHGQRQHTPAGPPRTPFSREGAPRQQQAEGEGGGEQSIAHLGAPPHQHERTQGKSQGSGDGGGNPTQSGRGGAVASQTRRRPAQEGVGQGRHRGHAGQCGGQPGSPAAKGIPLVRTRKGIEAAHQPVDQWRLVVAGQAVDLGDEPVAAFGHLACGGGEDGGRLINQPGLSQAQQKHSGADEADQDQKQRVTRPDESTCWQEGMQGTSRCPSGGGERSEHKRVMRLASTPRRGTSECRCRGTPNGVAREHHTG